MTTVSRFEADENINPVIKGGIGPMPPPVGCESATSSPDSSVNQIRKYLLFYEKFNPKEQTQKDVTNYLDALFSDLPRFVPTTLLEPVGSDVCAADSSHPIEVPDETSESPFAETCSPNLQSIRSDEFDETFEEAFADPHTPDLQSIESDEFDKTSYHVSVPEVPEVPDTPAETDIVNSRLRSPTFWQRIKKTFSCFHCFAVRRSRRVGPEPL